MPDNDPRNEKWAKEREEYGFDSRETWNLDRTFIEWIYTRVSMYKEHASKIVDLNFHKILYGDSEITQMEAIDKILELAAQALTENSNENLYFSNLKEICVIWTNLVYHMWW